MAVLSPPGYLQNAGTTHTAEQVRNWQNLQIAGANGAASMISRGGINPDLGNKLQVTQTGSPSMAVLVKSGAAMVPGTENAKQGSYAVANDADFTVSLTASHASLNRIDIIVFQVRDTAYSGGSDDCLLTKVDGTPSGSPSAPSAPANSIVLAQVAVNAGVTSVTNANITDRRFYGASAGGVITCTSTTNPANVHEGQVIYETDTDKVLVWNGASWIIITPRIGYAYQLVAEARTSTTTLALSNTLFTPTLPINSTWEIEFHCAGNGDQAGDIKTDWQTPAGANGPGGTTLKFCTGPTIGSTDRSNTAMLYRSSAWATAIPYGCDAGSGSPIYFSERSIVIIGGTAGIVGLRFAQNTSNATSSTIGATSFIKYTRIDG